VRRSESSQDTRNGGQVNAGKKHRRRLDAKADAGRCASYVFPPVGRLRGNRACSLLAIGIAEAASGN
jgi:hypothetical protein